MAVPVLRYPWSRFADVGGCLLGCICHHSTRLPAFSSFHDASHFSTVMEKTLGSGAEASSVPGAKHWVSGCAAAPASIPSIGCHPMSSCLAFCEVVISCLSRWQLALGFYLRLLSPDRLPVPPSDSLVDAPSMLSSQTVARGSVRLQITHTTIIRSATPRSSLNPSDAAPPEAARILVGPLIFLCDPDG